MSPLTEPLLLIPVMLLIIASVPLVRRRRRERDVVEEDVPAAPPPTALELAGYTGNMKSATNLITSMAVLVLAGYGEENDDFQDATNKAIGMMAEDSLLIPNLSYWSIIVAANIIAQFCQAIAEETGEPAGMILSRMMDLVGNASAMADSVIELINNGPEDLDPQ